MTKDEKITALTGGCFLDKTNQLNHVRRHQFSIFIVPYRVSGNDPKFIFTL